jgi:hypothetical protein
VAHLRANIHYILEARTEEYRGLIHQRYAIGKNRELTFEEFIATLVRSACETAVDMGLLQTTEELQGELDKAFAWCKGLLVEDMDDRRGTEGHTGPGCRI